MLRTLSRNIFSNWAGFAVQAAVTLILTPVVLENLGTARYGIWALVMGLTGYYGLFDLGVRAGMAQYMTRYLASEDYQRMNGIASTAFLALVVLGCFTVVVTLLVTLFAPSIFNIPNEVTVEAQWCILVLGLSAAAQFAFYPFASVFSVVQRYDVINGVVIPLRLLSAVAVYVALNSGGGLLALAIVTAVVDQVMFVTLWRLAYRVLPELDIRPRNSSRESIRPIVSFGFWSFFINGANRLKSKMDIIIIGLFMPVSAIAPYALALGMAGYLEQMFTPIGNVFYPTITHLDAVGESSRMKSVYLVGTRMMMLLAIALGCISAAWAADFFRIWLGSSFSANEAYSTPATLYYWLVIPAVCASSQRIGNQVCLGTRKIRLLATIVTCEVLLKVGLSVLLVQRYGLIGIALGTLIPVVLFQTILLPVRICYLLRIDVRKYLSDTCLRPLLVFLALVCLLFPFSYMTSGATRWSQLILYAAISCVIAAVPFLVIGLVRSERRRFVLQPVLALGRRANRLNWIRPTPPE